MAKDTDFLVEAFLANESSILYGAFYLIVVLSEMHCTVTTYLLGSLDELYACINHISTARPR